MNIYNQSVLIYDMLKEDVSLHKQFVQLEEQVCHAIKKKKSSDIFDICGIFLDGLSSEYFSEKGITLNLEIIKVRFSRHMYAQCVLDV